MTLLLSFFSWLQHRDNNENRNCHFYQDMETTQEEATRGSLVPHTAKPLCSPSTMNPDFVKKNYLFISFKLQIFFGIFVVAASSVILIDLLTSNVTLSKLGYFLSL